MRRISFLQIVFVVMSMNIGYAQTILNGDFEENKADSCLVNLSNSAFNETMSNCFAFGTASEIDIQDSTCSYSNPKSGNWFISLNTNPWLSTDALSMKISRPLKTGTIYQISYFEKAYIIGGNSIDRIDIGISSDSLIFGTPIYNSLPPVQDDWSSVVFSFAAPVDGQYIIFKNQGFQRGWNFIDDVQISLVTSTNTKLNSIVHIYPNPTYGKFSIVIPLPINEILIYNSLGQVIDTNIPNGEEIVNLEISEPGVYFILIITTEDIISKKVVICKY